MATTDTPVKDSSGDWKLNIQNPAPTYLTHLQIELTLTKEGEDPVVTRDQLGAFNLGKLTPGEYNYQYRQINTNIPGDNSRPVTSETFTVPADDTSATTSADDTSTTAPTSPPPSAEPAATTAIPLGNLHEIYVEEQRAATDKSISDLAILVELDKEIKKIIEDPVTDKNIDTRKISLQVHLQKLIKQIEVEETSLETLKSVYEHHGINEIIKKIEVTEVNLTNKKWKEIFKIENISVMKNVDPTLMEAYKEYKDSIDYLIQKLKEQRVKRKELKDKLKTFANKTLKKNLKTINELQEYSNKFKEEMNNTLQLLMAPTQTVTGLNSIQIKIGSSIERNHYADKFDELNKFEETMDTAVIPLNKLSTEYEMLDEITLAAARNTAALEIKYRETLASTVNEVVTPRSTAATTPTEEPGFLTRLFRRS